MKQDPKIDYEVKTAAHLALVEIVFGSVGHGFKVPFTGTFLSYYQLYISLGLIIKKKLLPVSVFNVAVMVSLLKTLSPLGKKITPMIAITVQGFLLWLSCALVGSNLLGLIVGSASLSIWSLVQSAFGYFLIYGFDFFRMIEFFQKEMTQYLPLNVYGLLAGYLILKVAVAWFILAYVYFKSADRDEWGIDERKLKKWRQSLVRPENVQSIEPLWRKAFRDLLNPLFFISVILMTVFHFYRDSTRLELVWFLCRTLGSGYLLFYLIRADWFMRILIRLFGKNRTFRRLIKKSRQVRLELFETSRTSD